MPDSPPAILVTPKRWWRSRLMALGAGVSLYGVATFVVSFAPTVGSLGGRWGGVAHVILGLAVAYLRARTSRPIAGTEKALGDEAPAAP